MFAYGNASHPPRTRSRILYALAGTAPHNNRFGCIQKRTRGKGLYRRGRRSRAIVYICRFYLGFTFWLTIGTGTEAEMRGGAEGEPIANIRHRHVRRCRSRPEGDLCTGLHTMIHLTVIMRWHIRVHSGGKLMDRRLGVSFMWPAYVGTVTILPDSRLYLIVTVIRKNPQENDATRFPGKTSESLPVGILALKIISLHPARRLSHKVSENLTPSFFSFTTPYVAPVLFIPLSWGSSRQLSRAMPRTISRPPSPSGGLGVRQGQADGSFTTTGLSTMSGSGHTPISTPTFEPWDPTDMVLKDKEKLQPMFEVVVANDVLCLRGSGPDIEPVLLSGYVILYLPEDTDIKDITLHFRGKARLPPSNDS